MRIPFLFADSGTRAEVCNKQIFVLSKFELGGLDCMYNT